MGQSHTSQIAVEEAAPSSPSVSPPATSPSSDDDDDDIESKIFQTKTNIRNFLDELPSMRSELDARHVVEMIDDAIQSADAALHLLREQLQKKCENDPIAHTGTYRLQFHVKSIEQSIDRLRDIRRECLLSSQDQQSVATSVAPRGTDNPTTSISNKRSPGPSGHQIRHRLIKRDSDDNLNTESNSPAAGSAVAASTAAADVPTLPDNSPALEPCQPKDNDVLFTRNRYCTHPGTKKYRDLIRERAMAYRKSKTLKEKRGIVHTILNEIRGRDPPGRFLCCSTGSSSLCEQTWHEVSDNETTQKVRYALHTYRRVDIDEWRAEGRRKGKERKTAAGEQVAICRGVSRRSTGMWQAQLYFSGQTRYIGVFEDEKNAALAYKIARSKLKKSKGSSSITPEDAFNDARRSAL